MVNNSRVVYDSIDSDVVTMVEADQRKCVILTFDDGPSKVLPQILDVLYKEEIPAVFFWQSRLFFEKRPWERVLGEGHIIGTHSTKHLNLTNLSYEEQYRDIANSVSCFEKATAQKITYFRPPFGQYNADTILAARALQLVPVMWKISSMDWELKHNPQQIITNITDHLEAGAIILLHELKQTLHILPDLIQEIKAKGYHFTTL